MITYPLNNIEYTAEDAELFHSTRTSGVYATSSFDCSVSGADHTISLGPGIAWIKNSEFSGKVVALKDPISVDMGLPDPVFPRIDSIVIQFDANENGTKIVSKKGTASSVPVAPPVVQNETVYELHLYHILRAAGELSISTGNVTDLRLDRNYCGLMADSVTEIDTTAIHEQVSTLISDLRSEIEGVKDGSGVWLRTDVIPIESGGTGAVDAESALVNLGGASLEQVQKKIEEVHVWSNASPGSSFAAQTLDFSSAIDESKDVLYAVIELRLISSRGDWTSIVICRKNHGTVFNGSKFRNGATETYERVFKPLSDGTTLEISAGSKDGSEDNTVAVPAYVRLWVTEKEV